MLKRETLLAILLGLTSGIGVGVVILLSTGVIVTDEQQIEQTNLDLQENQVAVQVDEEIILFEIDGPEEGSVTAGDSIDITGRATPGSLLMAQSPAGSEILTNEEEEFTIPFSLVYGENTINISFFPQGDQSSYREKVITVFRLPE